jgi:hypothetical protein
MKFLKCEEQLGKTVGPCACASPIGVVNIEVSKRCIVGGGIGLGGRDLQKNLMDVDRRWLIGGLGLWGWWGAVSGLVRIVNQYVPCIFNGAHA